MSVLVWKDSAVTFTTQHGIRMKAVISIVSEYRKSKYVFPAFYPRLSATMELQLNFKVNSQPFLLLTFILASSLGLQQFLIFFLNFTIAGFYYI